TFHRPVRTATANPIHATRPKAVATATRDSGSRRRVVGRIPAMTIWPPTHTEAARMCRNSRNAVTAPASHRSVVRDPGVRLDLALQNGRAGSGRSREVGEDLAGGAVAVIGGHPHGR